MLELGRALVGLSGEGGGRGCESKLQGRARCTGVVVRREGERGGVYAHPLKCPPGFACLSRS